MLLIRTYLWCSAINHFSHRQRQRNRPPTHLLYSLRGTWTDRVPFLLAPLLCMFLYNVKSKWTFPPLPPQLSSSYATCFIHQWCHPSLPLVPKSIFTEATGPFPLMRWAHVYVSHSQTQESFVIFSCGFPIHIHSQSAEWSGQNPSLFSSLTRRLLSGWPFRNSGFTP